MFLYISNLNTGSVLVPLRLLGEGSYALSSVKEISVTDDFLRLPDNSRKCQNIESFEQCVTKHNLASISEACKCIPYGLKNFSNAEVSNCLCKITCSKRSYCQQSIRPCLILTSTVTQDANQVSQVQYFKNSRPVPIDCKPSLLPESLLTRRKPLRKFHPGQ